MPSVPYVDVSAERSAAAPSVAPDGLRVSSALKTSSSILPTSARAAGFW